ncbi:MAG: M20 family metallopeptidase [Acidimicrobiia bacterium]
MDLDETKQRLRAEVDRRAELLLDASHRIHARPETNYQEHHAHDLLTSILDDAGFEVTRHAHGTETGFAARAGSSGPLVAVLCEYDALPGIGHACGHNIIAAAGLGAGLAAAALAEEAGGRVVVLGTPAEEGGGGKIRMARQGAFDGVDAAMMVHPAGAELARMDVIAVQELYVTYHGRAAHAAAAPHEGRNALDAAVLGYQNVAALRQHIRPNERIHGIFTEAGDKANIVPSRTRAQWMVRSGRIATLGPLVERVVACLEAGAAAAGCTLEVETPNPTYADMLDNASMVELYRRNAAALGREVRDPEPGTTVVGSTDMGNVSYLVPAIHPMIQAAPAGTPIHTPEFERCAITVEGDRAALDGAVAMAWTVADLWLGDGVLDAVRAEFAATAEAVGAPARRSAIGERATA